MKMFISVLLFFVSTVFAAPECNDGDLYFNGYCYFIPSFTRKSGMTHADARFYCQQKGYTLPSFHSYEQESFVVNMAIKIYGKGYNWIGLNNPGGWDDGSNVDYTNWAPGYPKGRKVCTMQYFNYARNNDANWRDDFPCSDSARFFCQYRANPVVKPTTTTTTTRLPTTTTTTKRPTTTTRQPTRIPTTPYIPVSASCDSSDIYIGTRCYSLNSFAQSYPLAMHMCQLAGKTLAIYDNLDQLNIINAYAAQAFSTTSFYIGLHHGFNDDNYYWPGNVPMTWENWGPGYPVKGKPAVVQYISNGQWQSSAETAQWPFVCSGYAGF